MRSMVAAFIAQTTGSPWRPQRATMVGRASWAGRCADLRRLEQAGPGQPQGTAAAPLCTWPDFGAWLDCRCWRHVIEIGNAGLIDAGPIDGSSQ